MNGSKKQERESAKVQIVIHKYPSFIEWFVDSFIYFKELSLHVSHKRSILIVSSFILFAAVLIYW